ncbi:hypothetical protein SAMN04490182_2005 [Pseudomonas cedrina]|uniref:Uncharacterized protein n=2 Tax=Pseudomonas cedrina TaxID=651740 RepID=A0A1V2JZN2_PSECE|nr:hypothetical protein [Pseudomonas cedrina]ONH50913.1 hypothetical protein BLL36_23675 [Pseudomonas cedrina subsp. cedrina]SDS63294.1 hypothetical protein SAMN04490182_2005 [Pseudomonas cedrina]
MNPPISTPDCSDQPNGLQHQSQAPEPFFEAWKQAVLLAGPGYFGIKCRRDLDMALSKWDLCPDIPLIETAIGAMSHGEQIFIAALVSFYNDQIGGELLQRAGVSGMADFGILDSQRRSLLARLLIHYSGW